MMATGVGFAYMPGSKDDVETRPVMVFDYVASDEGTHLRSIRKVPGGSVKSAQAGVDIASRMLEAGRAYLGFRALHESWATPGVMRAASSASLADRIAAILGASPTTASEWADFLLASRHQR